MSAAYESMKENISSIWNTIKNPLEFASNLSELGKMLVDPQGRDKLYKFIKNSIKNKMGNISQCLSEDELNEELCKLSGEFAANFVPPALMIKAIIKSVRLGKATNELNNAIATSIKNVKLKRVTNKSAAPKFSTEQIRKNSLLSPRDRVAEFEKLIGVKKGAFEKNKDKYNAILAAHNLSGTIGKLNFSQIRERVKLLRSKGFSDREIRIGLDAGIFGHLDAQPMKRDSLLSLLPKGEEKLSKAKIVEKIVSTKFGSGQSLFLGDNNYGIEILSYENKKVFSKIKYDPASENISPEQIRLLQDSFINESKYAKKMSDLGVGPKYYGAYIAPDGKYALATEFIDGFEIHLGDSIADVRKIKLSTIYEMKQKALKVLESGIDPFDLQFRVDKNGIPFIVDTEHFSVLDPKNKAKILKEIEADFAALIYQKKVDKRLNK